METAIVILISVIVVLLIIMGAIVSSYRDKVTELDNALKEYNTSCNDYKNHIDSLNKQLYKKSQVYKEDVTHWVNMYNDVKNKLDEYTVTMTTVPVENKPASVDVTGDNLADKSADAKPVKAKKATKKTNKKSSKDTKK